MILQPEIEAGSLADAEHRTARSAQILIRWNARCPKKRPISGMNVEVAATKSINGCNRGCGRISVHHSGRAGEMGPAIPLAILIGLIEQRLRNVRSDFGLKKSDQLELRTINVPTRKIGVLRVLFEFQSVDPTIHSAIAPIAIACDAWVDQRMIKSRREHGALISSPTRDRDPSKLSIPGCSRLCPRALERCSFGALRIEIGAGASFIDVGDADAHRNDGGFFWIKADPPTRTFAGYGKSIVSIACAPLRTRRTLSDRLVFPGSTNAEILIEMRDEMERIITLPSIRREIPAEIAACDASRNGPIRRIDMNGGIA